MKDKKFKRLVEKSLIDYEPDCNYEIRKCNKDANEVVQLIKEQYGDVLKRLSKS